MIHNIHILTMHEDDAAFRAAQAQAAYEQTLINAHRRGEHPWGSMRRDCPLCQLNK